MIDTYEKHLHAQRLLQRVYDALSLHGFTPPTPECCDTTPVVSYTEAEYIRDRLRNDPTPILNRISAWVNQWDGHRHHQDAYHPLAHTQYEVKALRATPCPFAVEGECGIKGLEPLQCRTWHLSPGARQPVDTVMAQIFEVLDQKTGFLPIQLYALLDLEGFTAKATARGVSDAMLARGTMREAL